MNTLKMAMVTMKSSHTHVRGVTDDDYCDEDDKHVGNILKETF